MRVRIVNPERNTWILQSRNLGEDATIQLLGTIIFEWLLLRVAAETTYAKNGETVCRIFSGGKHCSHEVGSFRYKLDKFPS